MRFWDMVNIGKDDECWEWKSKENTGERAYTRYKGVAWSVSRLAWFLTHGHIPDGMCVCHKCDNPPCCNPSHLFLGTVQDNVDDREQKHRNKLPFSRGEEHGNHKLSEEDVKKIRVLYDTTAHTYRSLAKMFSVRMENIRKIVKKQTWGWLS